MPTRRTSVGDRVAAALAALPDGVESDARIVRSAWTTIRFANSRITQPHHERTTHVSVRIAEDRRLGTATTSDVSDDGIAAVVRAARSLARVAPLEPKFPGFPGEGAPRPTATAYSAVTADRDPAGVTRLAEAILQSALAHAPAARVAGAVHVGGHERRVVNTRGLDRTARSSGAQASVLVDRPDRDPPVSGWSDGAHWDAARLAPEALGREAAERVATSEPAAAAPGAYRVVLGTTAVHELLLFLALMGYGGVGEERGWSCLHGKRGRRIAPPSVDLIDDPRSRDTLPVGIDFEGVAARPLPLIRRGVAGPAAMDTIVGGRLGRASTGHAAPPEEPHGDWGPIPTHPLLAPGDASEAELVAGARRGLWVTRFHYVRIVDPGRGIITGMTRDGTYRIERGEIAGPVRNLRFTDSVLRTLRGIELVGRTRRIHAYERGEPAITCPALLTRSFRFTSTTLF
ncbi:MAG TPA: TldD/PmbA family protein [Thermoplasmata archaeon]|nr:TldD/PmbA family protein [Thermoplasmata archaeon]